MTLGSLTWMRTTKNCKGPGRVPRKWSRQIGWNERDPSVMTPAQRRRAIRSQRRLRVQR